MARVGSNVEEDKQLKKLNMLLDNTSDKSLKDLKKFMKPSSGNSVPEQRTEEEVKTEQPSLQEVRETVKPVKPATDADAKKASKSLDSLQEAITGEKVDKANEMSEGMKAALMAGLPIIIGGLLGGSDGLGAGAKAAQVGLSAMEREKDKEAKAAQAADALQAKKDIEAEKVAVDRERIASQEKVSAYNQRAKLLGLKQAQAKDIMSREVPSVGIALSKEDANVLKEKKAVLDNVTNGIDRLSALGSKSLASLSPEQRTAAQTEVAALIGQLRIPLTGPGPLTDTEREFIGDLIGNPTKIWSYSPNEMIKLNTIKNKFTSDFKNEADLRTVEGLQKSKIQEELKRRGLTK